MFDQDKFKELSVENPELARLALEAYDSARDKKVLSKAPCRGIDIDKVSPVSHCKTCGPETKRACMASAVDAYLSMDSLGDVWAGYGGHTIVNNIKGNETRVKIKFEPGIQALIDYKLVRRNHELYN